MACIFISVRRLCVAEKVISISVLDKVDWAESIVLDKAAAIDI